MTKIKCICNKHFSIIVRGPNTEADEKSAYDNVQVGVWAPTQRISKRNSTGNASWGATIKKYFFFITLCPTHFPKY
ncbi:Nitrogen regulation protein NIFR3 [Staphylococcus aureus subsp. aureus DR10]|uniref:Nitrogen fixation protein NifR n=2 Tax=Staphylococcus aureus TaxID=1280 RepID=A0AAP7YT15_STAAU|nr:Nitrogen regulation protein NIFR3 [Staphylococcus aureus subsp. aureus 71193]AWY02682.1 nitrogen fixation protein NifR [Staphylococcus aureus]EIA13582.1 Nitrogen regulation protein NIFR3 [Staphylococcus aureus subsp. aureus DR10]AXB22689.1 nitrogen fixation protein NifR [Staphylococcus aureus]NAN57465.1 nitrogen fixation protein NifR [Staphylococcus aureus]